MNIALATDDKYALGAITCITSFLENNRNEGCHVYVLTFGLNAQTIRKFQKLSEMYNTPIDIEKLSEKSFNQIESATHRFPMSANLRMLLPDIIREDRVLYVDCDIIIRKNLHSFYNQALDNLACAVVENQGGDDIKAKNRIKKDIMYFNSGVLLINLDYWRRNQTGKEIIKYLEDNPHLLYPDQDALNAVLDGKVIFCDYTYNFQQDWYGDKAWLNLRWDKWKFIDEFKDDPAIVHYTKPDKPWHASCKHPHVEWYLFYAKKHGLYKRIQEPRILHRLFTFIVEAQEWLLLKVDKYL